MKGCLTLMRAIFLSKNRDEYNYYGCFVRAVVSVNTFKYCVTEIILAKLRYF